MTLSLPSSTNHQKYCTRQNAKKNLLHLYFLIIKTNSFPDTYYAKQILEPADVGIVDDFSDNEGTGNVVAAVSTS